MLLSDNWLRGQCEKPTHIVNKMNGGVEYASAPFTPSQQNLFHLKDLYKLTPIKTFATHEPPKEYVEGGVPCVRVSEIREITEEELANWKPMIEPFFPHLVNTRMREATEEENIAFNLSHPNFKDHPNYNPDWQMPEGGVIDINRGLLIPEKIISYGLSSYGYDLRIGNKFKIFTNINSTVLNPKNLDKGSFVDFEGDVCIIPPNSFVLAASMERLRMPRNVTGVVLGKSTYARTGIVCIATPLEAGWEGHVTLEFANTTPLPAMLFAGEGACQVLFFEGEDCLTSYLDRGGKYQNQEAGPVLPKV